MVGALGETQAVSFIVPLRMSFGPIHFGRKNGARAWHALLVHP